MVSARTVMTSLEQAAQFQSKAFPRKVSLWAFVPFSVELPDDVVDRAAAARLRELIGAFDSSERSSHAAALPLRATSANSQGPTAWYRSLYRQRAG
ncbi:hypothetical protein [Sphingomonas oryzagri]|uniref:Transposase n=1 Tax=Sphingomonas oryzagri TaxID=3042314 RepID=A0ABT6MX62_9SPHN|nr:hypothetical protein [Sphingomonas oryzagri]MDH7637649.1 hypothetical protein [Sphingomonas oryzagri]